MKVLLVEDHETVAKGLKYSFEGQGYEVYHRINVKDTIEFLNRQTVHLVILDISLPDGNGFLLYEKIIKPKQIPTIFLTAREEEDDIVRGLELGAEDYLVKPFSIRELMARVNRIVRKEKNQMVQVKGVTFDFDKMIVYRDKEELPLTGLEKKILQLFFRNCNRVITRNEIIEKIWEWTGNDVNDNTVTVYLKRIREKVGTHLILTVKGIGYRMDTDEK